MRFSVRKPSFQDDDDDDSDSDEDEDDEDEEGQDEDDDEVFLSCSKLLHCAPAMCPSRCPNRCTPNNGRIHLVGGSASSCWVLPCGVLLSRLGS